MSKGKILAIVLIWLVLFGVGAVAWRYMVQPVRDKTAEQRRQNRLVIGSSDSRYDHRIELALDSFSGYAVLRSEAFQQELVAKSIKVNLRDDGADYLGRMRALQSGELQMAAFTIDALVKTSSQMGDLPATIISIIDETRGADAIVGFKSKFRSVDDFNKPNVRFVLTPDSPSETLARVVMARFELPNLAPNPIVAAADAADVYRRYRAASPDTNDVFVLWEPYVSKMTQNPNVHTIVSSRDFFGYIVDVIVVSRDFLAKNPEVVKGVVESYFRAAYHYRGKMVDLVLDDARQIGNALTAGQALSLVDGLQWKDTQRNYAHFGITQPGSVQHVEDMIENITDVLVETGAIQSDPANGQPNRLYYKNILSQLHDEQFHPGSDDGSGATVNLRALSDEEWGTLSPVGTLKVPELLFARGTARLLDRSQKTLDDLVKSLQTSQYYVIIRGNATRKGDLELNKQLASDRASAAADYLISRGVGRERIRAVGAEPSEVPSVTFVLGQLPF